MKHERIKTMKNMSILKQVAVGLMLALTTLSGFGATVSYTPAGAATNTVFTGTSSTNRAGDIRQVTIANPSTTATIVVRLIDAPGTSLVYTNAAGAFTNNTRSVVTWTNIYEDILGNQVTNIYQGVTNTVAAAAAATNNWRSIAVFTVSSNTTLTVPYTTANNFGLGLLATNNGACTITVNYIPFQ